MGLLTLNRSIKTRIKETQQETDNVLKPIPDTIEEFAKLIKIESGTKYVQFELYEYQKRLYETIEKHRVTVVGKVRQIGFTQFIGLYFLFKACKNPAYKALVFSKNGDDTADIARRVSDMINHLGDYVELENDNKRTISIKGGGIIYFRTSAIEGGRSIPSVSDVFYDEAAFNPNIELIYGATTPCQLMAGNQARTIIGSTPNGVTGWYWDKINGKNPDDINYLDICNKVRSGEIEPIQSWTDKAGWGKFIAHWKCHPIYKNVKNYLQQIAETLQLPMERVYQEYDLSHENSGEKRFAYKLIQSVFTGTWDKQKRENSHYYIAFDPQFGGEDYAVAGVFRHDLPTNRIFLVDKYRKNKVGKLVHLNAIGDLVKTYKPEKLAIETNGGAIYIGQDLEEAFPHLPIVFVCSTQTRKLNQASKLEISFEKEKIIYPADWKVAKEEFLDFEKKDKVLCASGANHDDCVLMSMIATDILPLNLSTTIVDRIKVKTGVKAK